MSVPDNDLARPMSSFPVSQRQGPGTTSERPMSLVSPTMSPSSTQSQLHFTPRGTVGEWYHEDCDFEDEGDPGPSSSTYGPDLWKARRCAWLAGDLELNPPAPKVIPSPIGFDGSDDRRSTTTAEDVSAGTATPTSSIITPDESSSRPVLSAMQTLSAKARGKLPSFLHLPYSTVPPTAKSTSPTSASMLSSLEKLEILMAEPGAEENDKVWRQGGLEAIWRMLTDSKTLKQPMRLGLVIQILKAGWIRDGTWPSSLSKDGKSRRAIEAVIDDPFFASPPPSPTLVASTARAEQRIKGEREVYRPPKKL